MPDRLTEPPPATAPASSEQRSTRPEWRVPALQAAVIVALFAGVGCLAGWVWWKLWSPAPTGIAFEGDWYPQPATEGLTAEFAGTGWYVVVAVVAGLVLGVLCGLLLDRDEVVTLVAVVAGSVLAAWLMREVGLSFSPPDPEPLARNAADRTPIPGELVLSGRSPLLALPVGALAGLTAALFAITKHRDRHG